MQKEIRVAYLIIADIILLWLSYYVSLWIRFDGIINIDYLSIFKSHFVFIVAIKLAVFTFLKLYKSLWEYASIEELYNICIATFIANSMVITYLVAVQALLPRSVYILAIIFDALFIGLNRFGYRVIRRIKNKIYKISSKSQSKVLIIGAGDAGSLLIKELKYHKELNYDIVGILDDDKRKVGQRLNGVKVIGTTDRVMHVVKTHHISEIIIAIPSANKAELRKVVDKCASVCETVKILPGVYEIIDGHVNINHIREVRIEDLLSREQVNLEMNQLSKLIHDKVILVTGGAGSIGSELCRQILKFSPKSLYVLDICENSIYRLEHELRNSFPNADINMLIASIRDYGRIESIFKQHKPQVVFHAAAHKHVPLMEHNPYEAIKNNVMGTFNIAKISNEYALEKFVMISTDKAVNPTNIMGATKRFCEMIIKAFNDVSETNYTSVRFGNVLGSNGSVIPHFKRQISEGGPVTVTHKEIERYFMTIPEATQLVLQAGALSKSGEIFVLDMGEPVKIYDLACDLIRLSGLKLNEDIEIKFTGLRPGEKMYEELYFTSETLDKTTHKKIFVGKALDIEYTDMLSKINFLNNMSDSSQISDFYIALKKCVPSFNYDNEVLKSNE